MKKWKSNKDSGLSERHNTAFYKLLEKMITHIKNTIPMI